MKRVWPGRAVEEANLHVHVSELRAALGETPGGGNWIETMPRRGYRFVGPGITAAEKRAIELPPQNDAAPIPLPTPHHEAERRQITAMSCEVTSDGHRTDGSDLEDWREAVGTFQRCVSETVDRHGGFIARCLGSTVLVLFGFPTAHEHDAEQAVRAGLEVCAAVRALRPNANARLRGQIGIATGMVIVGDVVRVGGGPNHEIIGDAVNLAARLQVSAQPGTVVLDPLTRQLIGNLFDCVDLEAIVTREGAEPTRRWQVLEECVVASRFEALRAEMMTPLVGRQEELELLQRRWLGATSGEGQMVLLCGEPGIGKSRLIVELEQRIAAETHVSLRCFCSPHHQDSPLRPIITRWEHAAGFAHGDGPQEKLRKLEAMLLPGGTSAEDVALIADLLSVPTEERYPKLEYSPRRKKEKLFEALNRGLAGLARTNFVLLLFEDVHWADASTLELLGSVIDHLAELPVLLMVSFRPEFSPPWIGRAGVSLVTLSRLDRSESAALVVRVMREHALPLALLDRIVDQTDGVPLFIEELTKAVLEAAVPPDGTTLAVPDTLHTSLMARLDSLPAAKTVAQIGAVVGRSYTYELIEAIAELPAPALQNALRQLVSSGLVFERGVPPEASYTFKHALVQEAAYNSLLRSRRTALHASMVKALCARDPGIEKARPDLLAYHCEKAGFVEQAIEHYMRAGRQALCRCGYVEAGQLFSAASRLTAALPDGDTRVEAELLALSGLNSALLYGLGFGSSEIGRVATRAADLCERLPNPTDFLRVPWNLWQFHVNRADFTSALTASTRLIRWAEERGDVRSQITGLMCAGIRKGHLGELVAARSDLELAIDMRESCEANPTAVSDPVTSLDPEWRRALALAHLARPVCFLGYPDQALAHAAAAVEGFERLGAMGNVAFSCLQRLRIFAMLWEQSELDRRVVEALRHCREYAMPHQTAIARIFEGYATARRGDLRDGGAAMRQGLADYAETEAVLYSAYYRALLAETCAKQGDTDEALTVLTAALSEVKRTGERWGEAELARQVGDAHWFKGDRDAAESHFTQAIEIARGQSAKMFELRASVSLARLWSAQGKRAEARELVAPTYEWFTEGFNLPDLKEAKALLKD